ncbi:hypothetical protein [Haloplanus aerogenes]|uniref:hypothetical protein n=1 Tax=Haloplanus aerogenes TaxID=660522 RepID=UPI0013140175|nr:hypothetical protein [Haloplanus aerogenes]
MRRPVATAVHAAAGLCPAVSGGTSFPAAGDESVVMGANTGGEDRTKTLYDWGVVL